MNQFFENSGCGKMLKVFFLAFYQTYGVVGGTGFLSSDASSSGAVKSHFTAQSILSTRRDIGKIDGAEFQRLLDTKVPEIPRSGSVLQLEYTKQGQKRIKEMDLGVDAVDYGDAGDYGYDYGVSDAESEGETDAVDYGVSDAESDGETDAEPDTESEDSRETPVVPESPFGHDVPNPSAFKAGTDLLKERKTLQAEKKQKQKAMLDLFMNTTKHVFSGESGGLKEDTRISDKCREVYKKPKSEDYARIALENGELARQHEKMMVSNAHFAHLPKLGVIRLDYAYPPAIGDIDHPASYNFPVVFYKVPGLTFQVAQWCSRLPLEVERNFRKAIQHLDAAEVFAITGSCGFMIQFQALAMSMTEAVVAMSSLNLLPSIKTMISLRKMPRSSRAKMPNPRRGMTDIAIFTANGKSLGPMKELLESAVYDNKYDWTTGEEAQQQKISPLATGSDNPLDWFVGNSKLFVVGMENVPVFGPAVAKGAVVPTREAVPHVLQLIRQTLEQHPSIGVIIMECTELPPFSPFVKPMLLGFDPHIRYYDSIDNVNLAMSGGMPRYYPLVFPTEPTEQEKVELENFIRNFSGGMAQTSGGMAQLLLKAQAVGEYTGGSLPFPMFLDEIWTDRVTQL